MANRARRYHYSESLTTSTSAVTTDTTKVTLTYTPVASSTYVYIWSCDVKGTSTSYDIRVSLNNNAGTALAATNVEPADTTDWMTVSGIAFETFGASPTSQSVTLRFSIENTASTASIRNAKIIAIKLTSADVYVENTADQTTTSSTLQTATTLTFTPATTGSYLILGSCEVRNATQSAAGSVSTQITYSGTAYSQADIVVNDTTNYSSGMMQASVGSLTNTSKTVTLQWKNNNNSSTVYCRRARLLALRLDEFTTADIAVAAAGSTTTSLTYTNKLTNSITAYNALSYLVIGTATIQGSTGSPTTLSAGYGLSVNGTYTSESLVESGVVAGYYGSGHFGAFNVVTQTSTSLTAKIDYYAETASVAAGISYATISVLLLDPTDLYWVGGSGTWDSSATTNWALTSGGTGGAAAPKSSTNVNFDNNSDSAAPFTVTVSTGALCSNFTVSGLDNTMTLAGSAALSVYGNFSVPATNFTQSYTGTITFAGTSSKTITTNGKSFTAFTFDGVGGTWTLQDAFTLTGAVTLTNGTLALGSYTLTGDTFNSNNSNARTIDFGTGKIAITSASTATVWNTATVTNLTISGTPLVQLTGGGATTKTISAGALSEANSISFQISNTAGTVAFTASNTVKNLTIDNNSITISNIAITIYGNLSIGGTSVTLTAGANAWTFAATSGTKTITTNGETLDFPLTFNGAGGTWSLQDALSVGTSTSRTVTLTAGTLELNSQTLTIFGIFDSSNTNTRKIQMSGTGGKIVLSITSSATSWNTATVTGLTTDGNILVQTTGSGATSRTISAGALSEANSISFQFSHTAGSYTFTASNTVKNLTLDASARILNVAITIYGNLLINTSADIQNGTSAWTFAATSGTKTITTNSYAMDFPIIFNGAGGTWALQDAMTFSGSSRTITLTAGTVDLNSYSLTTSGPFSSTNTNTRRIQNTGGLGKIIIPVATTSTVWDTTTVTNLTTDGNVLVQLTGGGATTKTIAAGALAEVNAISFQLSNTTGTVTFTASDTIKNLTIDNNAFTLANIAITIYGNLLVSGTSPTISSGINVWTFAATSGTKTITTNGKSLGFPITFNGLGGTWALQDALSGVGAVILTAGTIELNSYTFTMSGFSSSNTNTRRIQMSGTGGKIVVNTSGTFWNTATTTGLTTDGNVLVQHTASSATTSTAAAGMLSEANAISFQITKTSGSITFTSLDTVKNLTYDGACSITNVAITVYGNFSIGTSMTQGGGSALTTFAATSGVKTITMNGVTLLNPVLFDGLGGTWQLQDNMTVGTGQTQYVTLNAGTIDLNGKTLTTGSFSATGTGAKVLAHGTDGSLVIVAISGTVFNATGSNLTSTGTGTINLTGATSVTFAGGGNSYNTLNRGAAAAVTITGSNTFKNITNTAQPLTVNFTAGTTTTFTSGFGLDGTPGNLVTIKSATNALHTLTKTFAGDVTAQYCSISYSKVDATGWYADSTSTDAGNNYQWIFSYANGAMIMMFQ